MSLSNTAEGGFQYITIISKKAKRQKHNDRYRKYNYKEKSFQRTTIDAESNGCFNI